MPRVWLTLDADTALVSASLEETEGGVPVEMNASLFRQIVAAEKKYQKFQSLMAKWVKGKPGVRIS